MLKASKTTMEANSMLRNKNIKLNGKACANSDRVDITK